MSTPEVKERPANARREGGDVESFESATAEVLAEDYPATERATLWVLAGLLVAGFIFISFAKLDRVVSAPGRLVPIGGTLTVQPVETQVISRILVGVGDVVKKGQVLAICDPTLTEADRVRLKDQVYSLDAQLRRLTAEESGQAFTPQTDQRYDELQERLFLQRKAELAASLTDFDHRTRAVEVQIAGLQKSVVDLSSRLRIASEMEGMNTSMSKEGYVSHLQLLGVQDQAIALKSQLSDSRSNLEAAQSQLAALREQRKVFLDHWHSGNLADMVTARNSLEAAKQELTKAARLRDLVNLVSPEDAIVTRVPQLSVGGVAGGAQPLFGLVPLNATLQVAVQIEPQDIGFVKVGDPVNLKFDAYKYLEHGLGHGVVSTFSQDSFADGSGGLAIGSGNGTTDSRAGAHFDARVKITGVDLHELPDGAPRLVPGMTLQADIVVGRRTILWYLLGGALRSGSEAMREP